MIKVNNKNNRTTSRSSVVFIATVGHTSHLFLVFLVDFKQLSAGLILTKKISMTSLNETLASFDCNIPVVMYYLVVECQGIDSNDLH